MRVLALPLILLTPIALLACTTEEEPVANRFERTEAAIENKAHALEAQVENEVSAVEARLDNEVDVLLNAAEINAGAEANQAEPANTGR